MSQKRRVGCGDQGVDILRQRTQKEIAKRSCTHALEATSGAPASRESSAMEERRRVLRPRTDMVPRGPGARQSALRSSLGVIAGVR